VLQRAPLRSIVSLRACLAGGLLCCLLLASGCGGSGEAGDDIAFVSSRDGDYAIFGMNADGSSQRRLTDERGDLSVAGGVEFQTDPAWSPDGTQLAFASAREGSYDIYVMNADGTGTTRLTSSNANDQGPTWSPDGSRIAFSRSRDGGHVWVMNADGTGARRLTDDLAEEGEPAWSPDGRWIAYTHRASGSDAREIWVSRPDGTGRRSLTNLRVQSYAPAWAPDSRRLAFSANRDSARYDIYTVGIDGKDVQRPVRSTEDAFEPAWSPDGSEIAFSRDGAIVAVTLAGAERRLTDPDDNDSSPAWNPAAQPEAEGG
jgi:Tol biopolymer transport system component